MKLDDIKKHWDNKAKKYSIDLLSTTKTSTIKQLEIDAFSKAIKKLSSNTFPKNLLEVGCGNGHNIFGLAQIYPDFKFVGIDYSNEMIQAAKELSKDYCNYKISFSVGDVLKLKKKEMLKSEYDFVLTDRLLINLNSWDLQKQALKKLVSFVKQDGYLIIIENFVKSYKNQNQLRQLSGLPNRTPDPYNKFIDESKFEDFIKTNLQAEITMSKNFASLHDILLYVLLPQINSGNIIYDHPLMQSVTDFLKNIPEEMRDDFGRFGQNNLYVLKRR